jgi:predicted kinase
MLPRTIFVLVGCSGSGKSTFAKYFNQNCGIPILSSDSVREEVTGREEDMSQDGKVWKIIYQRSERMAQEGSFIFDATNLTPKSRKFLVEIANKHAVNVKYIYLDVILPTAKRQNKQRERQVPDDVIEAQFKKISLPQDIFGSQLVYVLGFDSSTVTVEGNRGKLIDILKYSDILC